MTIDRINPAEPIQPGKKAGQTGKVSREAQTDSISLSEEAVARADLYRAQELVNSAEDVRAARIAELKRKINDPSYIDDAIIRATADKILDAFGL
jgi:negative regulator of flagellin synthesis FlgM